MENINVNLKNWKSLIKPPKLDIKLSDDKSFARIIAEPLEKGYGLTLGNSLRRILLSSIRGAAVTSIQIDGVLHEFTSIKGVREDVTDIVLNIKSLALKNLSEGKKKLILDAKGPGEIKASDITPVADIEILNPDLIICNLDEKTNFHMEMTVGTGKGYVSADMNKPEEPPLGLIPIDSLFSPVKRVSYSISTAREGKAFVLSTFNNTIISISDTSGNVVSWSSAGQKGFKGSRKSTPYAAQVAADSAAVKALEFGMKTLTVEIKGPGSGRETALRALQARGFKILSIKDTTPLPHNGTRPPKKRRV